MCSGIKAEYEYVLDNFSKHTDFYTAFNVGSGSLTPNTNAWEFQNGTGSLQLDYNFNAGSGSFFSAIKNYGTQTVDWSYQLLGFYLNIKGGNENTQGKLRIWEDHNKDGIFNGTDEVYSSLPFSINSSTFEEKQILAMGFTKVTGVGNDKVDWSRVRAFDIAIENSSSSSNSGAIQIDQLKLVNTYTPLASGTKTISGSFIQLWNSVGCNCGQFSLPQWKTELQKMKDACMNSIFIQYGIYDHISWYSPSSQSQVTTSYNTLNLLFQAAEEVGVKLHLGLYFDESWNSANKSSSSTYSAIYTKHQSTIDELWSLFGNSSSFGGWYIPQEINDLEWQGSTEKNLLFSFINDVTNYAKSKDNSKPIAIAPFFNLWLTSDELASWYDELFTKATSLDQVYIQDGVGITLKDPDFHIPLYFSKLKPIFDQHAVELNMTLESFQQLTGWPLDEGNFSAEPASWDRLKKQLWAAEKQGINDVIQFSWQYMQPGNSAKSDSLYKNYRGYSCNPTSTEMSDGIKINAHPNPAKSTIYFNEAQEVTLMSLDGTVMRSCRRCSQMNINDMSSGIYLIKSKNRKTLSYDKILINK